MLIFLFLVQPFVNIAKTKIVNICILTRVFIEWINGIEGPFTINVLTGKSAASMQRTNVSLKADGTAGYYDWVVSY